MKAFVAIAVLSIGTTAMAQLPNYDAVSDSPRLDLRAAQGRVAAMGTTAPLRAQWDDRFGTPTFIWAPAKSSTTRTVAAARLGLAVDSVARNFVAEYSSLYGATPADVEDAYVANIHDTGRGAIVVKLRQRIGDIDVFRDELNVVMDRDRELIAMSGRISALPRSSRIAAMSAAPASFLLSAASALRSASSDATSNESVDVNSFRFLGNVDGGFALYDNGASEPLRAKRVYFHLPDQFVPAYYVELYVPGGESKSDEAYGYVVSAIDGRVLFRNDLTADQAAPSLYSYRVWTGLSGDHPPAAGPQGYDGTPNPTGTTDGYQPTFIAPNLVTTSFASISTKDPWLPNDAVETRGNNVDAFVDLSTPDGFSAGDFRATPTSALMFDRVYDVTKKPDVSKDQQMAAITQLFYNVNYLHDWYYDAGFNEAAGNAQNDNFGRGGLGSDSIRAEAQDFSGRNNANMLTPSDGGRPRMQMYVWDGAGNRTLRVDSPSSLANLYATGLANFGPVSFDLNGEVVSTSPVDGCTAITTNLTGKIAFIDRGGPTSCTFQLKNANAKAAGAIGVLIGNIPTSASPEQIATMGCNGTCDLTLLPSLLVTLTNANAFRSALQNGTVRVLMHRDPQVDRDGTIDNQIVAHEWMHYMTNRLIGDGNGLVNPQGRGMGEGWSDFNSMLLTVRPEDTRIASNANWDGAYATAVYATSGGTNGPILNNGTYYGIRRVPYSTELTRDPLTLKHVTNGVPLVGAPVRVGNDGANNAEVHATGEVWATMLWEAYAALLRDTLGTSPRLTFAEAQQRMKEYMVASLKITPVAPTFLEARDAVLAAAFARDKVDYQEFWQAFAKRGAGLDAIAAERYSASNAGVTEDFNGSGGMEVISVAFDDSVSTCLRNGLLDGGETGMMRVSLKNIGAVRLQATSLSVGSSDSSLSFAQGGSVIVPASNPGETVIATVNTSLASSAVVVNPDLTITISDPQITTTGGIKSIYHARLNSIEIPKDTATDDVEASTTAWAVTGGSNAWTRREVSGRDHRWLSAEPWDASDMSLVSPTLMVASAGPFSFSFRHRFAFDFATNGAVFAIDGGVLEITTDDGHTWTDIGDKIDKTTTGYGNTPIYPSNGSVIENRRAFIGTSPNYNNDLPSLSPFTNTNVSLGSEYAGKRVRIRFRAVTGGDHSTAPRNGWEIDDISFTNIQNLPFTTVGPDRALCSTSPTTTALSASSTSLTNGQTLNLTATVSSAGVPVGTVDFFDNGAILATARVENGIARTGVALTQGTHTITAAFNGSKYSGTSASSSVSVQVGSPGRHRAVGK
jgi:hypothetical protein